MIRQINKKMGWDKIYLILCLFLLLLIIFFLLSKPWGLYDDFWEVAAAVQESSINFFHPNNPILLLPGNTSPRFVPYTLFWGFFKRLMHLDIFLTMFIAGLINFAIFSIGLYRFVSRKFKSDSLPTYTLLVMLLVWGSGVGWANAYQFEVFLESLPLVCFFVFGLSLNALFYLVCYCEEKRWSHLFLYFLLSVICFVTHPITGLFCFVTALSLLLEYRDLKQTFLLQGVPLLAFCISLIWPYFSYWDVFIRGTKHVWFTSPLFSNFGRIFGLSIIGFPVVIFYAFRRKQLFLLYGVFLCSMIYIISAFFNILIGGRFIIYLMFFLHLSIAWYLEQNHIFSFETLKKSLKREGWQFILIVTLLVSSIFYRVQGMGIHMSRIFDKPFKIHAYDSPLKPYSFLNKYLSDSDIVMMNAYEARIIPAITGARVVAPQKYSPLIVDEINQRKRDVVLFFRGNISLKERINLLKKYRVTHLLIDLKEKMDWDASFIKDLEMIGIEIVREGMLVLYRINQENINL